MSFYPAGETERMLEEIADWSERGRRLLTDFIGRRAHSVDGQEMVEHGFCRRLSDLDHFTTRLFEVLPPDATDPSRDAIKDATGLLHAFIVNTYGAVDNLAWIWVFEKPVRQSDGSAIPPQWVGLRPTNTALRASLSPDTEAYVAELDRWFGYLEDFRHHLAHRVPLYIPPLTLDEAGAAKLKQFQAEAMVDGWSLKAWLAVMDEMQQLGSFAPWMTHTVDGFRVPFHRQVICDFMTVIDLGERILRDLRALQDLPPKLARE